MNQMSVIIFTLFFMQSYAQLCTRPFEYLCANEKCIYSGFQCDGENDCGDRSDELQCDVECYTDFIARDYRGFVDQTKKGTICQKWTSQSPHKHTFTPSNYLGLGLGEHNYCRNPSSNLKGAWCYTTNPRRRWQFCNVGDRNVFCNSVDSPKNCGGRLDARAGTFTSPRMSPSDSRYPESSRCTWIIQAPNDGVTIQISFTSFDMDDPYNGKCYDWLQIFNAKLDPPTARAQGVYCGDQTPPLYVLTGNYFWLQFSSNERRAFTGFVANYNMVSSTTAQTTVPPVYTLSISPGTITGRRTVSPHLSSLDTMKVTDTETDSFLPRASSSVPVSPNSTSSDSYISSNVMTTSINEDNSTYTSTNTTLDMLLDMLDGKIAPLNSGIIFGASVGAVSLLILLSILACILHRKSRKKRRTTSTYPPTAQSDAGLTNDTQRDAASGGAGQSETGNTTHTNDAFQPNDSPITDTGIYHEIRHETEKRVCITVQPDTNATMLNEDTLGQHEKSGQIINAFNGHDEERFVENDIYSSIGKEEKEWEENEIYSSFGQEDEGWEENDIYSST